MSLSDLTGTTHFLDLVSATALRLYQATSLDDILRNIVHDVQRLLETDRVIIYQMDSERQAHRVAIKANPTLPPLPAHAVDLAQCLQRWLDEATLQQPRVINNLATADLAPCEQTMLVALGIEASVLVPIYLGLDWQRASQWQGELTQNPEVWGFLVVQQSHPRRWSPLEISFLRQLTQHLFHAIRQMQMRQFSERLIESAVDGIIALDTSYRYQVWNGPMEKISGRAREEVIGQVAWNVFPCLKDKGEDKLIAMTMAGYSVVTQNQAFTVPETGRKGFFEIRYSPLTDSSGKVLGCLGLVRDITEQKQTEYQLRATTSRLTSLIQNLQAGVLVEDQNRHILLANEFFHEIFQLPPFEELRGEDCQSLLAQTACLFRDPQTVTEDIHRILKNRQPVISDEVELVDGRTLERDYIPIFIGKDYQGHLWQYRDISQRKQEQQQLEQAIKSSKAANQAKSNFLATMSHEIRTPLNAIIGLTDLLRITQLNDEQQDFVDTIHNSGSMLLSLINDILDFSKIEADKLELERRVFDLHRCIQEVVNLMTPLAEEKGLVLRSHLAPDVPRQILGDVTRLRQVLLNLVSNGVKFTQKGSVTINVEVNQPAEGLDHTVELHVAVQDTGIGIPDENCDGLFQAFSQLDASVARRYGGTGLGLAICKKLVEAMGGTIGFGTQPGVGTTFYFTLQALLMPTPLPHPSVPTDVEEDPHQLLTGDPQSLKSLATHLPLHILVVDDLSVNQKVVVKMLQRLGYEPDYVGDGIAAIDRLQHQTYDLVLMDIQMPGMDGYETTELIRQLPSVAAEHPWIVAMTAHSSQHEHQRSLQIGMNDFLSKPILLVSLIECLMRYGRTRCPECLAQVSLPGLAQPQLQVGDRPPQPLLDQDMIDDIRDMAGAEADTLLAELITNYQDDANRCLEQLQEAINHQDGSQIRHYAHALRSMSVNLGALSLASLCQELELRHRQMSTAEQQTTLAKLQHTYADVLVALHATIH